MDSKLNRNIDMIGVSYHNYINKLMIKYKNEDIEIDRNREFVIKQINLIIPKVIKFFCSWFLSETVHQCNPIYPNVNTIRDNLIKTIINDGKPYINDKNKFISEFMIRSNGNAINNRKIGSAFDLCYYTDQSGYILYNIMNII